MVDAKRDMQAAVATSPPFTANAKFNVENHTKF